MNANPESFMAHFFKGMVRELLNPPPPILDKKPDEIKCPHCHADVGSPCITPSGRKARTHRVREKSAYTQAVIDSKRCINKLCCGGKVWTPTDTINCPMCQGTGIRQGDSLIP